MTKMYLGDISAGSLLPNESRAIARLLLSSPSESEWTHAIKVENILQKNSPATAIRQAQLIRKRLTTLNFDELTWVAEEVGELHLQILMVAAIRQSRLLGDFMIDVYQRQYKMLEKTLNLNVWDTFLHECEQRDPTIVKWNASTRAKLLQVIVRILAESRFFNSSKALGLTPPFLHPQIARHLRTQQDTYVLKAMEITR